jgi:hypothetical protein
LVADPNVSIMESKALTAHIQPGRHDLRRHPSLLAPTPSSLEPGDPRRDLPQVGTKRPMPSQEP